MKQQQQMIVIIGIVVVAVAAVGVLILASGQTTASAVDFTKLEYERLEDGGVAVGSPDAKLTLVEFADYACPHCIEYKPIIDRFVTEFVATGKARYELRIFPTAGGQQTVFTGQLAYCIEDAKPGSYYLAGDLFFDLAAKGQYQNAGRRAAEQFGLDYNALLQCTQTSTQIDTDTAFGRQVKIGGTPAVAVRLADGTMSWISANGRTYNEQNAIPPYDAIQTFMNQNT